MPLGLLAGALVLAAGAAPPGSTAAPLDLAALREAPAGGARAAVATAPLVGAPYVPSALGEGEGPDGDPRFRLDAFDCMTFVETALALASASSLAEARLALDDVRYAGAPSFATRNHEVLSQWIPANVRKGWIAELTRSLAGSAVHEAAKEYTAGSWRAVRDAGRAIAGLPRDRLPLGRFSIPIVAPEDVVALAPRVPQGTIVFVVRADAPDRATRIAHAGLVVRGPAGAVLVRHATPSRGLRQVIEEPLARFVRRQAQSHPGWLLEGFAFYAIPDATARVRALSAALGTGELPPARAPARL